MFAPLEDPAFCFRTSKLKIQLNPIAYEALIKLRTPLPSQLLKSIAALTFRDFLPIAKRQRCRPNVQPIKPGGAGRDRTDDLVLAKHALSQLSYSPGLDPGGSGWIRTIDPRLIKTVL